MSTETLGGVIARARKGLELSQKELAQSIKVEDGNSVRAISPQYLNDIERDRRVPSSSQLIEQFASVLKLDKDYLSFLAGRWPDSMRESIKSAEDFSKRMVAFRSSNKPVK